MPVKVLDSQGRGGIPEVVAGIRYAADHGADVINLSLGTRPGHALPAELVRALQDAVAHAERRGAIVVAAAGNHGTEQRTFPAALPDVVGVAAHARSGGLPAFSARGDWLDLAAPACHEVQPVLAMEFCGTSAAAPAVSGILALLRDLDPDARPVDHRTLLHGTGRPVAGVRHGLVDGGTAIDRLLPEEALRDALALAGDWNGDGIQTPGWFRDGRFHLRMRNDGGPPDRSFTFGRKGDVPLVGDWNGDGRDTIGIVRRGEWHLRDRLSAGPADRRFVYGRVGADDVPVVGDWNGDGRDAVGIVRGSVWHLRDHLTGGVADRAFVYGRVTRADVPLTGDWNGDGRDTVGIVRAGEWHLRDSLSGGPADHVFIYGRADGDRTTVGDWTGDGLSTPAITRGQTWHQRRRVASGPADEVFRFYGY